MRLSEEEFLARHGDESHIELIDGLVVRYDRGGSQSAYIGANIAFELSRHVDRLYLGRLAINDTFVRVRSSPVRIRCVDVLYLSYAKWPADRPFDDGPCPDTPELVAELKSPAITWVQMFDKVVDFLTAGVVVVLVLDTANDTVTAYRRDTAPESFRMGSDLTIPDVLPGFSVPVASLFL